MQKRQREYKYFLCLFFKGVQNLLQAKYNMSAIYGSNYYYSALFFAG